MILLVGDIYNVWYNMLMFNDGMVVVIEFGIFSVSLSGMEDYLKFDDDIVKIFVNDLFVLIIDLNYCNFY